MKKPIRILSLNMDILAEIDNYESMFFNRSWHGIGAIELRINRHMKYANTLLKDNLILIGTDLNKVFIIKHREIELDENGKITENWLIKGYALKSIVAQRITIPPNDTSHDNKSGSTETVMKHYVNNHLINPVDSRRRISQLIIAPDKQRGVHVDYSSRYKNVAEEVSTLSLTSGLGWDVTLDIRNKKWVFDVVGGKNLIAGQSLNPPVIFSPQFESLKSLQYTQSELNYKNVAIVAGQGEGVDRRVIEVLGNNAGTAINRHEVFIDARDVAETDDEDHPLPEEQIIKALTDRGKQNLQELMQEEYLEGQILTNSPFKYQKDYDLGDVTTIQNNDWGITMDARITEIKEVHEATGFSIEATFGNDRPTLIQKIKQELSQISGEVRR
ncbi:siphovirus ReqiPepy6 Gp37-like family protein [Lysinibacillus irui]|uniref:siphovirus ReqiPepy6 Gp37-like family protein n=1 Tax=Lysinibacillus irui TaxID=2998077 RepID=UPI002AD3A081|nr:siphovirus ReqiPepy6 Gp37-like family protein [Lysinibacillus irui]MEA0563488.1 siphovirus ReqiPepy6 Gp37-like family protein [Lysinibacillus irui]